MHDFVIFVGGGAALSDELRQLTARIERLVIVCPAMSKNLVGVNRSSVIRAIEATYERIVSLSDHETASRLTVWTYGPPSPDQMDLIWAAFGRSAWIEFIPLSLKNKVTATRLYIERRILELNRLIHEISYHVIQKRKSSPISLPLLNFSSLVSDKLRRFWYRDLDIRELQAATRGLLGIYNQLKNRELGGFVDQQHLCFQPAEDSVCHGQPHPTGSNHQQFIAGRFRFGVALHKGFHYEVTSTKHATLQISLYDGGFTRRDMRPEKRRYINIFPNDHLLPAK